jgi:hypothetical protein
MHLTLGSLRKSQAVSCALSFFWLDGFAVPAPARVTQTVRRIKDLDDPGIDYFREQKMNDKSLRDFFKFDEEDLIANRNGKFSIKQQNTLNNFEKRMSGINIGCGTLALVITVILIFSIINKGSIGSSIPQVIGSVIGLGIGIFILYFQFFTKSTIEDVIVKIEGPIKVLDVRKTSVENPNSSYLQQQLRIGKKNFIMDKDIPDGLIEPDDIYAVYYKDKIDPKNGDSRHTEAILSVEWLSKGKAK